MNSRILFVPGVALFTCLIGCGSPETPSQSPAENASRRAANQNALIPYTVVQSSEFGSAKASFDVRVDLVNGRLPTEAELVAISQHLKDTAGPHDRTFVVFYLPGMVVDAGGYATAHHNPNREFRLLRFNVPERYAALLPPEDLPVQEPGDTPESTKAIEVSFDFSLEWEGSRPVIAGETNLPDGTQIMTSVSRKDPPFMAQDKLWHKTR